MASNKYQVAKTFRDGDKWYAQGQIVELASAGEFLAARVIVPLVEVVTGGRKPVETADKKNIGAETRDGKQKGN